MGKQRDDKLQEGRGALGHQMQIVAWQKLGSARGLEKKNIGALVLGVDVQAIAMQREETNACQKNTATLSISLCLSFSLSLSLQIPC